MSNYPLINYIIISNFSEDNGSYQTTNIYNFQNLCETIEDKTIYEFINCKYRRFYVDIDHIPKNNPNKIFFITYDLISFFEFNSKVIYTLTINRNSNNEYLSYHLYFPYKISQTNIRAGICQFILKYPKYKEYIDDRVYKGEQLMRPLYSKCAKGKTRTEKQTVSTNKHELLCGNFFDSIIQNTKSLPLYQKTFILPSDEELLSVNITKKYWYESNGRIVEDLL